MVFKVDLTNQELLEQLPPGVYCTKTLSAEWVGGDLVVKIEATNNPHTHLDCLFPLTKEDPDVARRLDSIEPKTPYFPS